MRIPRLSQINPSLLATRSLIFLFLGLNLISPLYFSSPDAWIEKFPIPDLITKYAIFSGMEARWAMFSKPLRAHWRMYFDAVLEDGTLAPIPTLFNHPGRSALHDALYDFKFEKFDLNIEEELELQDRYAAYLCRTFPRLNNQSVKAIRLDRTVSENFNWEEARRTDKISQSYRFIFESHDVPCPPGEGK